MKHLDETIFFFSSLWTFVPRIEIHSFRVSRYICARRHGKSIQLNNRNIFRFSSDVLWFLYERRIDQFFNSFVHSLCARCVVHAVIAIFFSKLEKKDSGEQKFKIYSNYGFPWLTDLFLSLNVLNCPRLPLIYVMRPTYTATHHIHAWLYCQITMTHSYSSITSFRMVVFFTLDFVDIIGTQTENKIGAIKYQTTLNIQTNLL